MDRKQITNEKYTTWEVSWDGNKKLFEEDHVPKIFHASFKLSDVKPGDKLSLRVREYGEKISLIQLTPEGIAEHKSEDMGVSWNE